MLDILLVCVFWMLHINSLQNTCSWLECGIGSTSSISLSGSAEYPFQSAFIKLKRRLKGIVCGTMTGWALTQIGRCWVCGIGSMIDLHLFAMLPDAKMRSGLLPFFHLAILKDFSSLASWMSVRSHESAHCSTASALLYVVS